MLLEVETESFLLLEDGVKIVLETSLGKFIPNEIIMDQHLKFCSYCLGG